MAFNPDAYLQEKTANNQQNNSEFNPDAYLQSKAQENASISSSPNIKIDSSSFPDSMNNLVATKIQEKINGGNIPINQKAALKLGIPTIEGEKQVERIAGNVKNAPTAGIIQGLRQFGQGIGQLGIGARDYLTQAPIKQDLGIADNKLPQYTKDVQQQREQFNKEYQGIPNMDAYKATGETAPYFLIPAAGGGGTIVDAATYAAMGSGISGSQFANTPEERKANIERGAAFGAAIPLVFKGAEIASKPIMKAINAVKGKLNNDEYQALVDAAQKHNVPLSYGDVTQGPISSKTEIATESMPFVGAGKFREIQNQQARLAAEKVRGNIDFGGGDWSRIAQTSLSRQANKVKNTASSYYDDLEKLADQSGPVKTPKLNQTAKAIIDKINKKPEKFWTPVDKEIVTRAQAYLDDPNASFSVLRQLRSDLGDEISDFYSGSNGVIGKKGASSFQQLKSALEADMADFAKQKGGKVYDAWKKADNYYRTQVIPFKDAAVAKAIKTSEPDTIYSAFIKRGRGDRAQNFYNLLDEQGRSAVRYGMVDDAFQKATSHDKPFSPAQFAKSLEDITEAKNVFFKGKSRQELDGFIKLMRHAKRAGQYMENPPTGQRVIPFLLAGGAYVSPTAVGSAMSASLAIKGLFTTKIGRNFLLASSKLEPGSPQMQALINQIQDYLVKIGSSNQSANQPGTQTQLENTQPQ